MTKKRDRMTTANGATPDPMQAPTPTAGKRAAKGKKVRRAAAGPDRAQCTAHKRNGDRCSNPPVRGAVVCRMHGGSAPQVRAKANQRLVEMILPALAHLRKIVDSPSTSDADKLKAIQMILNRTGYSERQQIDIGLREPSKFDELTDTAFVVLRGRQNIIDPADEAQALPSGGGDEDQALNDILDKRDRDRQREASTRLDNRDHDVVRGVAVSPEEANLFGFERTDAERYRDSGTSEFDPDGTKPKGDPWQAYERRLREDLE